MTSSIRYPSLRGSWYPGTQDELVGTIHAWESSMEDFSGWAKACIVPHAGWYYSGAVAWSAIRRLERRDDQTVVVLGGHLPPGRGMMYAGEDHVITPLGTLNQDRELLELLLNRLGRENLPISADDSSDNTVEVQLPMVHYHFGAVKILCLRIGAGKEAIRLGNTLYTLSKETQKPLILIGSTDLTHYGPSYHMTCHGLGEGAFRKVRDEHDRKILLAFRNLKSKEALELARTDSSACSAGAAAAVMEYARLKGCGKGSSLVYRNSYEISPGNSFVGYGSMVYEW